jgi:hypothetical protein
VLPEVGALNVTVAVVAVLAVEARTGALGNVVSVSSVVGAVGDAPVDVPAASLAYTVKV